jgi:AHBA synthesis associated protein
MPELPTAPLPPSLVIFDLDGTLIDSRHIMMSSFRSAYAQIVGPGDAPVEQFLMRLGKPFPDILDELGLPSEMYEAFRSLSSARVADVVTIPEAIEACHLLRAAGVDSALITGKDRRRTEEILAHHKLGDLFSHVVAGDDEISGKPAPDGVVAICKCLDVDPTHTVVVGDSWVDIAAGAAAGTLTAACGWGIGLKAELHRAQPDVYIEDPADLFAELHAMLVKLG